MHRLAVPPEAMAGEEIELPPAQAHHVADVLRIRPGERVVLFDGRGTDYLVELTAVGGGAVRGKVLERRTHELSGTQLILVQAVPKGAKMDLIVRMGTEVGIYRFLPVLTRRAVARPAVGRLERWRRIAQSAAAQSGRSTVPEVDAPMPLESVWTHLAGSLLLLPWEGERVHSIGTALRSRSGTRSIALLIGPEGGWAPEEVEAARTQGAHVVSLGPLKLRTETAGLVAAAMILYELTLRESPLIGPGRA